MSRRAGIMLCYPFEEKRLHKWGFPVLVQPKLDGMRCRAFRGTYSDEWFLVSSEVKPILSVPHINEALSKLHLPKNVYELDGELYTHGMNFNELVSRTKRTTSMHSDSTSVEYHIFDIIDNYSPFLERNNILRSTIMHEPLKKVPSFPIYDMDSMMTLLNRFMELNYEGIIIRHPLGIYERKRSTSIMKFKPRRNDIYSIKGYSVEVDKDGNIKEGFLGKIICAENPNMEILGEYPPRTKLPDGYFGVGSGFTRKERKNFWDLRNDLSNSLLEVAYQHTTPGKGVPRFPVYVQLIETEPEEDLGLTLGEA